MNAAAGVERLAVAGAKTEPEKLGGLLVRMPDIEVKPRDIKLDDNANRFDPGGKIAVWQAPGNSLAGITVVNGFGTSVEKEGLAVAQFLNGLYGEKKRRPTITLFDYRGLGQSTGLEPSEILVSRMRSDFSAVLEKTQGPQVLVAVSLGGGLALMRAQREYEANQRYYAPRKVLAVVALNPAVIDSIGAIDRKARIFMTRMQRRYPQASGLTTAAAEEFVRDGQRHGLRETLSQHNVPQNVFGCPVVVVQGLADKIVPPKASETLVREAAAPAKLYIPLPNVGHDLTVEGTGLATLKDARFPLNGTQVTLPVWLDKQIANDRRWIIQHHGIPKVVPAVRQATATGALNLWRAAARAAVASGEALVRAAGSSVVRRARAMLARNWDSAMKSLLPPKVPNNPPAAPDRAQPGGSAGASVPRDNVPG